MRLEKNIIYVDIKDDFLFVGYAEMGIDVFNIKNSDDIKKVGRIDQTYWDDEKNADGTWGKHKRDQILYHDFNVNESSVGVIETENSETKKHCPACNSWYHLKYTTKERLGNHFPIFAK
jgi:hypothetical protein